MLKYSIHNAVLQDIVVINGEEYYVDTYIDTAHCNWPSSWCTWVSQGASIMHKTNISEHTLEAAERHHKYIVEHAEEILREREMKDGSYF